MNDFLKLILSKKDCLFWFIINMVIEKFHVFAKLEFIGLFKDGLYTYDRKPKFDMKIFKEINSKKAAIEE